MKDKPYILYRHTSPSGKCYIGVTCQKPRQRWGKGGKNYKDCPVFWNAIKKYGWDNFKHEIIHENIPMDKICALEIETIAHYKKLGLSYNTNVGGEGSRGHKVSDELKQKLRGIRLGKPGTILSPESRRLISLTKIGEKNPMYGKPSVGRKPLYAYTISGDLIERFEYIGLAVKKYNIPAPWFSILKDGCKERNGIIWSFGEFQLPKLHNNHQVKIKRKTGKARTIIKTPIPTFDNIECISTSKDPKSVIVKQFDIYGKFLMFTNSGREARQKFGISLGCITAHKNKPHFFYKGAWYKVEG